MTEIVLPEEFWKDIEPGTEALVEQWLAKEGEQVAAGQVVAKVVLVKAALDVTAPYAGILERILVPAEKTFAKGRPLATMREA